MFLRKNKKFILGIILGALLFFVVLTTVALAQGVPFTPNVTVPGSEFKAHATTTVDSTLLARYIKAWYKFGVGIAGILAVLMIAYGGVVWLFSGGASEKIGHAKELITGAVIGLVLALGSYLILNTVNPNLVSLKVNGLDDSVKSVPLSGYWCRDIQVTPEHQNEKFKCKSGCDNQDADKQTTKCGGVYEVPGLIGTTCRGFGGCTGSQTCGVQYWKADKPTGCAEPINYCSYIYDDTTSLLGLSDGQSSCDWIMGQIIKRGDTGQCLWVDHDAVLEWGGNSVSWLGELVFNGRGGSDDGCYYFNVSNITASCTQSNGQINMRCADYNLPMGRLPAFLDENGENSGTMPNSLRKSFCLSDSCSLLRYNKLNCQWSDQNGCY